MPELALDDITLHYQDAGDPEAPAVVLLHGFTSDLRMWTPHVDPLSVDYRVVAPDMRGHGASGAPEAPESYTMEGYAEDLRDLLDHLGVDVCALVGCSFGGMVALQFATTWPERIAGLVLSDTSAAYDHPAYAEECRTREQGILATEDIARRFGMAEVGKRAAASITDPFLASGMRDRYARMSTEGFLGAAKARRERPDLLPVIRERLTMPTLVCIGENDPVRSGSDLMVEQLTGARYSTFRDTGHGIPARRPELFAREVLGFFTDIEEGRPIAGRRTV